MLSGAKHLEPAGLEDEILRPTGSE